MSERGLLAAGKIGINLNTDENVQDGDDISATGVENLGIVGGAAHDVVSGQGGAGTGGTLDTTTVLSLSGGDGPDSLTGGKGNDFLEGDGNDDLLDGGGGYDSANWQTSPVPVHVTQGLAGSQDTGDGEDTLVSIEAIEGSHYSDVLRADPMAPTSPAAPTSSSAEATTTRCCCATASAIPRTAATAPTA